VNTRFYDLLNGSFPYLLNLLMLNLLMLNLLSSAVFLRYKNYIGRLDIFMLNCFAIYAISR